MVLVAFLIVGAAGYFIYSAVQAQYHLSRAQNLIKEATADSKALTTASASELLSEVQREVSVAHKSTTGPVWWTSSKIPFLGRTPTAIRTVTATLSDTLVATEDLQSALASSDSGASLRDLKFILNLSGSLVQLSRPIQIGSKNLSSLELQFVPGLISDPVRKLTSGYQTLAPVTSDIKSFSLIAPALFGLDKPRTWMLVFQNGAEARSVGGFPGGWGILRASAGRLELSKIYKETELMQRPLANYEQYVSEDQARLYGSDLSRLSDLNLSPDFPTNARLMAAVEKQNFGRSVDGVISMNEQALANFMKVTGPVTVAGRAVNSDNVADYVTKDVYQQFPNPKEKDEAVFSIIEKTFGIFQTKTLNPIKLLQAFVPAIHEQNLHAWSNDAKVQSKLVRTPIGGSLRNLDKPTSAVVLINGAGNKLDAYIKASIVYDQGVCESEFPYRDASFTIDLENTAPTSGLPAYVTTRYDLGDLAPANPGATKMLVYVHVPLGSVFESAKVGNRELPLIADGTDLDRQVFRFDVELPAKSKQSLVVKYAEPALGDEPKASLWTQSMPNPISSKVIAGLGCK